jgi:hypothetical protein
VLAMYNSVTKKPENSGVLNVLVENQVSEDSLDILTPHYNALGCLV